MHSGVPDTAVELGTDTRAPSPASCSAAPRHRFPDIQWIFSHAGGTAPALMQRLEGLARRKDLAERVPNGVAHYMERFFYDTAMATSAPPLAALTKVVKPTQIVFGTDYPFASSASVAAGLRQSGLFSADDLEAIERGNAARIMPRFRA